MSILEEMLEKDKAATGATGEEKKEEVKTEVKQEPKIEAKAEEKVEGKIEEKKEEPKKEEPKAEEKKDEYWKEFEFESPEALKEFINKKKSEKVEGVKPKFANTTAESYNNWVLNGGVDDFGIFQSVNKFSVSEKPSADEMVQALVLKEILDDPERKGKEAILERKIRKQYMLDLPEDAELDEDEKGDRELKLLDLNKEFKKTAQGFKELQSKTTPVKDEALETRLKENPAKLKEHLDKEVPTLNLDIRKRVKSEKGEVNFADSLYNIKFDESMQKSFRENYETFCKENNFPSLDDGSHKEMKAVAMVMAIAPKLESLFNDVFEAGLAAGESKQIEQEIKDTNPTATGTHEKKSVSTEKTDRSGDIFKR